MILSLITIGRFLYFPLEFSRKPAVRMCCFSCSMRQTQVFKGCSYSTSLLFEISKHPFVFQNYLIAFRKFLHKIFEPDWFNCKLLLPRCPTFILLSIFSCKRCFVSWLTVICGLPSLVRNIGVDTKTLHVGKVFFIRAFNSKRFSRTVWRVNSYHHFSRRVK